VHVKCYVLSIYFTCMDLSRVAHLEFPPYPHDEISHTELRQAYVKASMYVTLALEEASFPHSRSQWGAAITDATYPGVERESPEEYLELAHQEIALAVAEAPKGTFRRDLEFARQTIASAQ